MLRWATDDFRGRGIDSPRLDAELLLGLALGSTRIPLIVDAKRPLEEAELARYRDLVKRRARELRGVHPGNSASSTGAYSGSTGAFSSRDPTPRPSSTWASSGRNRGRCRCEPSTYAPAADASPLRSRGSVPRRFVVASDLSEGALAVARDNALRLGAYGVAFRHGDLFDAIDPAGRVDLRHRKPAVRRHRRDRVARTRHPGPRAAPRLSPPATAASRSSGAWSNARRRISPRAASWPSRWASVRRPRCASSSSERASSTSRSVATTAASSVS